jgi:prevent-host-death family protein
MQTLKASEFKARCLKLMDEVQRTGDEIVITKNGKPVSKLVPYRVKATTLLGLHEGKITSFDNDIFSSGEPWEADG